MDGQRPVCRALLLSAASVIFNLPLAKGLKSRKTKQTWAGHQRSDSNDPGLQGASSPLNQLTPQPWPVWMLGDKRPRPTPAATRMPSTSLPCWWWEAGLLVTVVSLSLQVQRKTANATLAMVTPRLWLTCEDGWAPPGENTASGSIKEGKRLSRQWDVCASDRLGLTQPHHSLEPPLGASVSSPEKRGHDVSFRHQHHLLPFAEHVPPPRTQLTPILTTLEKWPPLSPLCKQETGAQRDRLAQWRH